MKTKKRKSIFKKTIKGGSMFKEPCDINSFFTPVIEFYSPSGKKYNRMLKTCVYTDVKNNIYYLTTRHFLKESIDSVIIQKYYVMAHTDKVISCKIMIKNKYIGCFVKIKSDWYAILRQSFWMAPRFIDTKTREIYFKFKPGSIKIDKDGLIYFPHQVIDFTMETITIKDEDVEQIMIDENHSTSKKKTTDEIFQILDIFRLNRTHNYI